MELIDLYGSPGAAEMYDEAVTELEHGLQAAARARADGAADALVAAALLHDVGHLALDDVARPDEIRQVDRRHERAGARYLARWFGPEVTAPVALHVAAKRYLCAVEPDYLGQLSPASIRSLDLQGGPMIVTEIAAFEANDHHHAATLLRRWDDHAKVPGLAVPGFIAYVPLLRSLTTVAAADPPTPR
jgi:gamma-butyrobetaine dioxygenase